MITWKPQTKWYIENQQRLAVVGNNGYRCYKKVALWYAVRLVAGRYDDLGAFDKLADAKAACERDWERP